MDWSTVIPVVIANLVAILVAVIAWLQNRRALDESHWQHEAELEQNRTLHDLDGARALLDEVALKLRRMSGAIRPMSGSTGPYIEGSLPRPSDSPIERAADPFVAKASTSRVPELRDLLDEFPGLEGSLEIRFGSEHEILKSAEKARGKAISIVLGAGRWLGEAQGGSSSVEMRQSLRDAASEFETHRKAFIRAGQRWAGVRLKPRD